jgi:hypothetical protein
VSCESRKAAGAVPTITLRHIYFLRLFTDSNDMNRITRVIRDSSRFGPTRFVTVPKSYREAAQRLVASRGVSQPVESKFLRGLENAFQKGLPSVESGHVMRSRLPTGERLPSIKSQFAPDYRFREVEHQTRNLFFRQSKPSFPLQDN